MDRRTVVKKALLFKLAFLKQATKKEKWYNKIPEAAAGLYGAEQIAKHPMQIGIQSRLAAREYIPATEKELENILSAIKKKHGNIVNVINVNKMTPADQRVLKEYESALSRWILKNQKDEVRNAYKTMKIPPRLYAKIIGPKRLLDRLKEIKNNPLQGVAFKTGLMGIKKVPLVMHGGDIGTYVHELGHITNPKSIEFLGSAGMGIVRAVESDVKQKGFFMRNFPGLSTALGVTMSLPSEAMASARGLGDVARERGLRKTLPVAKNLLKSFGTYGALPATALAGGYGIYKALKYLRRKIHPEAYHD